MDAFGALVDAVGSSRCFECCRGSRLEDQSVFNRDFNGDGDAPSLGSPSWSSGYLWEISLMLLSRDALEVEPVAGVNALTIVVITIRCLEWIRVHFLLLQLLY